MTSQPSHSHPQAGKGKGLIADGNVSIPSGNITDLTPHREIRELNQVKDAGTDKHDHGWRYIIELNNDAATRWFSVNMGTGIVSMLLYTLPYNGRWLYWLSIVFFALNALFFLIFFGISILRYVLYPSLFPIMITHPTQSLFLGTLPMGFATLINMLCLVCVPAWGQQAGYVALAMWIVDAVLSVFTCFGIIFIMITRRTKTKLGSMSVAWLLPSASCVVAAASGGIVAEVVPNSQIALEILVTSFILWGIGISLASMVIVIYLMRLMLHKLPPKAVIVSTFLPLFPIGEGGFGTGDAI
uniref:Sulfite efflux pump SSU1 n=1 Tax=Talaromyces marneffei PM1 TaxID=1077442 RepID=A0A093V422_TALMA